MSTILTLPVLKEGDAVIGFSGLRGHIAKIYPSRTGAPALAKVKYALGALDRIERLRELKRVPAHG